MDQITDCLSEINNTQLDNAKDLDAVITMYNLTKNSDNYLKTSESLSQHYGDEPALDNNDNIVNFLGNSVSFKSKLKITRNPLLIVIQKLK